jgi:hypothetical protein
LISCRPVDCSRADVDDRLDIGVISCTSATMVSSALPVSLTSDTPFLTSSPEVVISP